MVPLVDSLSTHVSKWKKHCLHGSLGSVGLRIHALRMCHMLSTCALNAARAPQRGNDVGCSYSLNNTSGNDPGGM